MRKQKTRWAVYLILLISGLSFEAGLTAEETGDVSENIPIWKTPEDPASIAKVYAGNWRETFQNRDAIPESAKTRVWWWWLNSNVDKKALTRDLEEMARIGIGGLNLIDAGGASRPNWSEEVPVGPLFGSPEWRELFIHALNEARRLNIEIGLNIQSGWNLGGPDVAPEEAAWTLETTSQIVESDGKTPVETDLAQPTTRYDFYRDIAVFALPISGDGDPVEIDIRQRSGASSTVGLMADNNPETFWVSEEAAPITLDFQFDHQVKLEGIRILPRDEYGPKTIEVYSIVNEDNEEEVKRIQSLELKATGEQFFSFPAVETSHTRLVITDSYDPRFPDKPRNAQIRELCWTGPDLRPATPDISRLADKTGSRELGGSAPHSEALLDDVPSVPGEMVTPLKDILDLTSYFTPISGENPSADSVRQENEKMENAGHLKWNAPAGRRAVVRIGYTVGKLATVSTCTPGSGGFALNPLDPTTFNRYWNDNIEPLIELAGDHVGTTWRYCHTDSWELGGVNWSNNFRDEFRARRGYDLWNWLPVIAGKIVESREASNRFLADFRKTIAECIAANHYDQMNRRARRHGMRIHPESGGPHGAPIDGLMNIGHSEIPMMEFWCKSKTHRVRVEDRHFVKQGSSAANIYNRHLVQAEGFTTIGPHWEETMWDNMRPTLDYAATEGLNRFVWHQFTCSPESAGFPGQVYFAGTHCNPQTLWWPYGQAFFDYLNRSQFLLQQGIPTADVLVYYGDWIPNFVRGKKDDPANILPGYDYDVVNEEALLEFAEVADHKIVFPSGAEYQLLVLPERENISLPVLRKLEKLVRDGARILGPKPSRMTGLNRGEIDDAEVQRIAGLLWYPEDQKPDSGQHEVGRGMVFWGKPARTILADLDVTPALEIRFDESAPIPAVPDNAHADGRIRHIGDPIAWVQRKTADGTLIYLISNQADTPVQFTATFREENIGNGNRVRKPELWDAVSGKIRPAVIKKRAPASENREDVYRTSLDLRLEPFEGVYVVFKEPDTTLPPVVSSENGSETFLPRNFDQWETIRMITGVWNVDFYRPENPDVIAFSRQFEELSDWCKSDDENVRYFSGRAVYRIAFDWDGETDNPGKVPLRLNLGMLREISRVKLNGQDLGVCWTFPFRVDVTDVIQSGTNELEISVSNFWPNALIGDHKKPEEQRVYRTNVIKFNSDELLKTSGLLGPVTLERQVGH